MCNSDAYNNLTQSAIKKLVALRIVHSTSMTNSTIAATDNTEKVGITLPKSIVQKIDQRRGDIPRSQFIRRAVERYLGSNSSKDIDKAAAAKTRRK